MRQTWGVIAVLLTAVLLAGCTANSSGSVSTDSSGGRVSDGVVPAEGTPDNSVTGTTGDVNTSNRDVITTGSMSITAADPVAASESARTITEQAGGRVDSRSENPVTDIQSASATLTLRIPSDELDHTIAELKKLGRVNFVSLTAQDVTQQSQDLDARITALTTSVDRLLALMASATTTADLISIESALSSRQGELESLQSQRDFLSDQIDYSTVQLELVSEGTVAAGGPDNFWTGIIAGWTALVTALGGLLIGLGVALPWLVVLAIFGAIVLLIVRLFARRRKAA
ncbi:DUF4349 domain-containing protein [Cryobacterium sp. TMT1-3]|uniref:DUF4349 domain-containing protein n=1 Tax=Cryobacterium luteum TaxID=1424661 RepID=A0A1H8G7F9_9MICO|nr:MULTISPECIES: DUF4349 domain-containing protein [Cryobacterium]TFB93874.1 DUF4349 domain-containing protein [Cryobacterium luteum]TFC29997.1 DUF4349 domain-containing protein [Cryobacterium sp. TMT1-3]SEN39437.1 protein of unknown function [Cryobacterium luteum]